MGPVGGYWWVPGIALPAPPLVPYPGYTSPSRMSTALGVSGSSHGVNMVVGLRSVHQLTLGTHFSGFRGITEGYNLVILGNPNVQNLIPGTK